MELGSPSSVSAPLFPSSLEKVLNEPVVIGAWPSAPSQRSLSPLHEFSLDQGSGEAASEAPVDVPLAEDTASSFDMKAALDDVKVELAFFLYLFSPTYFCFRPRYRSWTLSVANINSDSTLMPIP